MGAIDGYLYWIAYSFECMPPSVRVILEGFAQAYNPVSGFVLAGYIDGLWEVADVPDWEWWKATYHHNLQIQQVTIVVDGEDFLVYLANRAWMWQLQLELLAGRVSVSMPFPCQRLIGFGIPVEIT